MSKNTNNAQKNSPKSFVIMGNALGINESKLVELINKKESVSVDNFSKLCMEIEDKYSIGLSQ